MATQEISPCPYRGETLLEKRRFSNVNQIDKAFDPDLDDDDDSDTEDKDDQADPDKAPDTTDDSDSPGLVLTESSAPAEEGEQSGATNYSPATAETEYSGRKLDCCCVIS